MQSNRFGVMIVWLAGLVLGAAGLAVAWVDPPKPERKVEKSASSHRKDEERRDAAVIEQVLATGSLIRVTERPYLMNPEATILCRPAGFQYAHVHGSRYCDVFVTKDAATIMRTGEGTYPVGTFIVKAKYSDENRTATELYTVMRKMPTGYAPEVGDWEFSIVDAPPTHVLARGKISSCISCHDNYPQTDFVTRTYLK